MAVADYTKDQLKNVIKNHEDRDRTDAPAYLEAVAELQQREAGDLNLDVTIGAILDAAREGRFLTYGDVAKANGAAWAKVRRPMASHLDLVLKKAHARSAPMITSIVVNEGGRLTGDLADDSLAGFSAGVRRLRVVVDDEHAFLKAQQSATFEFAKRHDRRTL